MNYKHFFAFLLSIAIFHLNALSNDSSSYKEFRLTGKILGLKKGTVYQLYTIDGFGTVWDSCILKNGKFEFNGKINEPILAEISLDRLMPFGSDRAEIMLESGQLNIKAKRDSFYALHMTGSRSQKDFERLSLSKRKDFEELLHVREELKMATTSSEMIILKNLQKSEELLFQALAKKDS